MTLRRFPFLFLLVAPVAAQDPAAVAAYRYAAGLYQMEEYELAASQFSSLVSSFPRDSLAPHASYWLGESLMHLGRYVEAADAFGAAARPGADLQLQEDARLRRAEALWSAGDGAGALAAYENLLAAHPLGAHRGKASYWLGRAYLSVGRKEEAVRALANAAAWLEDPQERAQAACLAGDLLRELGRCEEAQDRYRDALRLAPVGPQAPAAWSGLGSCAMALARWDQAADAFRALTESFPGSAQASAGRFLLAEALAQLGRHAEALGSYRAVLRDQKAAEYWDRALYGEAFSCLQMGDTVAALASLARLPELFPQSALAPDAVYLEGQVAYSSGQFRRAVQAFTRLLSQWPTSPWVARALYWRAWAHHRLQDLGAAERDFTNYAAAYPDSDEAPMAMLRAGLMAMEAGSPARAIQFLERARQRWPTSQLMPQILSALVSASEAAGRDDLAEQARGALATGFVHTPEGRVALLQKGMSALQAGRPEAAVTALTTLLGGHDLPPDQVAAATLSLAEAHFQLGEYGEAESLYARSFILHRGQDLEDESLYGWAWSALKQGKTEDAAERFARLARDYPTSPLAPEAGLRWGHLLFQKERFDEAALAYGTVVERFPTSEYAPEALFGMAWCRIKQDRCDEATVHLRRLVELYPSSSPIPDALYDLAFCASKMGKPASAARSLELLLERFPTHSKAAEAAFALATTYDAMGSWAKRDSAIAFMERSPQLRPVAAQVLLRLALGKLEDSPAEARDLLRRLVTRHPATAEAKEARLQLARLLAQEDRHEEAYGIVQPLCTDEDQELAAKACLRAAESKRAMGAHGEAISWYQRALALKASGIDQGLALYGLAWSSLAEGDRDRAVEALRTLHRHHKESAMWADGSYRLAQLLAERGATQEASDVYAALGENPQAGTLGLDAMFRRALLLRSRKAYSQAEALLRKVAAGSDQELALRATMELGRTLHEHGRLSEATSVFLDLASRASDSTMVQQGLYSAGVCQAGLRRWTKAAEYFGRASQIPGPLRADALLGQGWAVASGGDHRRAVAIFQSLLDEFPDYPKSAEVSFRLAQSLMELGRHAQVDSICAELVVRQDWPYPDRALYLGATAKEKMGDRAGAVAAFRELIQTYPSSSLVPYARAHLEALTQEG